MGADGGGSDSSAGTWLRRLALAGPVLASVGPILLVASNYEAVAAPQHVFGLVGSIAVVTVVLQAILSYAISARWASFLLASAWLMLWSFSPLLLLLTVLLCAWIALRAREILELPAVFAGVLALWLGVSGLAKHSVIVAEDLTFAAPAPLAVRGAGDSNIYWIVLDGYSREDVLEELYGDPTPLAHGLRERGFFVATDARADYAQTSMALAAVLNLDRVEQLVTLRETERSRQPLRRLIRHNRVASTLRSAGYAIRANRMAYSLLYFPADHRFGLRPWLTEIDHALLSIMALSYLTEPLAGEPAALSYTLRHQRLHTTFDGLAEHDPRSPTFTFAHLLAPHPPFVVQRDGTRRVSHTPYSIADGTKWLSHESSDASTYRAHYLDMSLWVADRTLEVVDRIRRDDPQAVIVVHSDHGGASELHLDSVEQSNIVERMSILNAVYLPQQDYGEAIDDLTPLDSMKLVFNTLFDTRFPIGETPSTFSSWDAPYRFVDVTAQLRPTGPPDQPAPRRPSDPGNARGDAAHPRSSRP